MANYCEVYQKRSSLILYILGCLIFMGIGFLYFQNAEILSEQCSINQTCCVDNPLFYNILGRGLLTYFGLCIFVFLIIFIRPYKLFYLNDEGFWSKDYGFIEWNNLETVSMLNIAHQTVICFTLKDTKNFKIPLLTKIFKFFNRGKLYIEISSVYDEVNEIFKIMKSCCDEN